MARMSSTATGRVWVGSHEDCLVEGSDVPQDGPGSLVGHRQAFALDGLAPGEPSHVDGQALDVGAGHGLGAQQEPRERLQVGKAGVVGVEGANTLLHLGQVGRNRGGNAQL